MDTNLFNLLQSIGFKQRTFSSFQTEVAFTCLPGVLMNEFILDAISYLLFKIDPLFANKRQWVMKAQRERNRYSQCNLPLWRGKSLTWELPWWLSGKEFTCQSRRLGFNPWNIPHATKQLSPCTAVTEHHNYGACTLEPRSCSYGSPRALGPTFCHTRQATARRNLLTAVKRVAAACHN